MVERYTSRTASNGCGAIKPEIQKKILAPCQFCGSERRGFQYPFKWYLIYRTIVKCQDCGYTTKEHGDEWHAAMEWNEPKGTVCFLGMER